MILRDCIGEGKFFLSKVPKAEGDLSAIGIHCLRCPKPPNFGLLCL